MKTKVCWFNIILPLFFSTPLFSQFIAIQDGDKVEVRNISGGFLTSGYYSGLKDIAQGDNFIVMLYDSDKIEIRGSDLNLMTTAFYSNLKKIATAQDYVVLHYDNGKIEVRNKELKYYNSWNQ
ncbi:MAG: hypothetical protein KBC43_08705 [Bacteroidales bacterium]|nr:hypothetical protein [Bacteroidales bacterium]